jgi:two-component system, OmpR family, sensor histidine kinase KdpD
MWLLNLRKQNIWQQLAVGIATIVLIAGSCFLFKDIIGYKIVALLLLMAVSVLAMLFDIIPVLVASLLSALIWNFFFIPPLFTFHIETPEDILLFAMYFIIAVVNAVLTFKIRLEEKKSRDREEKQRTLELYNTIFNSLSHELKTPVATIIGAVDTLKEYDAAITWQNRGALLEEIEMAGARLHKEIDNLLNMSRLETGMLQLNLQWCDVNELMHLTLKKLSFKNNTLIFNEDEELPYCMLDGGLLAHALYNILQNAVTYTPPETIITITITVAEDELQITIADNGNGIPAALMGNLFDKFYRLPGSKTGGTGLGLSIAKGFTEAHGGSISAANNHPKGLLITIKIPVPTSYLKQLKNE